MALGIIDKLTNFLMPIDEEKDVPQIAEVRDRRSHLKVHTPLSLKVYVDSPSGFDDVRVYADYLKANVAVIINFANVDGATQQRMSDFLNGVCYITGGMAQRVSDNVVIYGPAHVEINKELYAYSVPTYIKRKVEL